MRRRKIASHVLPKGYPMRLTKANVAKLSLPEGKSELLVFDDALAGFGIRLRYGGKRTWIAQYRIGSKQRRMSLGSIETLDAEEARRRAKSALSKVNLGTDPQIEKAQRPPQGVRHDRGDGRDLLGAPRGPSQAELPCRRATLFAGSIGRRCTRSPCTPSRARWSRRGSRRSRQATAYTPRIALARPCRPSTRGRSARGWPMKTPSSARTRPVEEISRDRVLNADELRLAWQLAGAGDFGAIVRLLILTGQRREEVGGMLWSELDLDAALWSIGKDRTKNGLPHDVPLSSAAVAILRGVPRRDDRDFVFGSSNGPFQGWSNAKAALDARMAAALKAGKGRRRKADRLALA